VQCLYLDVLLLLRACGSVQTAWTRVRTACMQLAENRMKMVDIVLMKQREAALLAVQSGLVTPNAHNAHITKQGDLNHYTLVRRHARCGAVRCGAVWCGAVSAT
jgi:hypothetical protein